MDIPDLTHLAVPGTRVAVKVTPKASRARLVMDGTALRAYVTVAPEDGKANAAVQALLAKALGVAKSRVVLLRGQTSRDKIFEIT